MRQLDERLGDVESGVVDVGPLLGANVFHEVRRATAEVQHTMWLGADSRANNVEHYAVACAGILFVRPVDAEMVVAVALQTRHVVGGDRLIAGLSGHADSPARYAGKYGVPVERAAESS